MKINSTVLLSIFAAAFIAGCGASSKITKENYDRVKEGMTRAEVVAILGEPTGSELIGKINDQEIRGPVWQGSSFKIVMGFSDDGKLQAKRMDKE
jgi:hypothetical protein